MARFLQDRSKSKGKPPGSLIHIGNQKIEAPIIQFMQYNAEDLVFEDVASVSEAHSRIDNSKTNWINIYGIHDTAMIETIGKLFNLPALLLEDILNTDQWPKYENGDGYDAFILKFLIRNPETEKVYSEQVSIILGENFVLTLQEQKWDFFQPVRDRIRNTQNLVRLYHHDYLTYALIDTIVDNYFILLESFGRRVEEMEDVIFEHKERGLSEDLYKCKTELNFIRKSIRPLKDQIAVLLKTDTSMFKEENKKYLKDLNELVIQLADTVEVYNNLVSDQLNIHNTNVGNRMNEIMKVLTIFASIFIPVTFIAGVYGMNFEFIPELSFKYSYLIFWIVILIIIGSLLFYFKKKKWL